jgi:hypothetical protein
VKHAERFKRSNGGRKIILGVDRLDYSKGIAHRLRAFADLLERHPEERERVQFVQIAVPSRLSVKEYRELKREIDGLIGQINGTYATPSWVPVNYLNRSFLERDLAAYYRAADVALVTPIKDGMNLVAKEFCAASVAGKGVLVLSEFAGAAAELSSGALIVNPHDTRGVADALHRAITMPAAEQEARLVKLRRTIREHDVHRWAANFLAAARGGTGRLREPEAILDEWTGWRAENLLVSLDYDGTLVPIRPLPGMAAPTPAIEALLAKIAALPGVTLALSSGRSLAELDTWFPNPAIVLVGGHGRGGSSTSSTSAASACGRFSSPRRARCSRTRARRSRSTTGSSRARRGAGSSPRCAPSSGASSRSARGSASSRGAPCSRSASRASTRARPCDGRGSSSASRSRRRSFSRSSSARVRRSPASRCGTCPRRTGCSSRSPRRGRPSARLPEGSPCPRRRAAEPALLVSSGSPRRAGSRPPSRPRCPIPRA